MSNIAEAEVAPIAAMMGDRARCAILYALLDGSERPAGELARAAGVSASTTSGHLRLLVEAGLLDVRSGGRHRYYSLAGPLVAAALEALALIAPPAPIRSMRQARLAASFVVARTCYDHLAGNAGVDLRAALLDAEALEPDGPRDHKITEAGWRLLADLGVDDAPLRSPRRILARDCLDLTERRLHLAGALPAALLDCFIEMGWLCRRKGERSLVITELGQQHLATLGRDRVTASAPA